MAPPGSTGDRKHPALAADNAGRTIMVWTEGTGWMKGGSLAWQVFDEKGRTLGEGGRAEGIAVWSFAAAVANSSGSFTIIY